MSPSGSVATLFGAPGTLANAVVIAYIGLYLASNIQLYQRGATRLFLRLFVRPSQTR